MANDLIPISPKRRSARDWREIVGAYGKRSCTRDEFCRRHAVAVSTLDWWRRKFAGESKSRRPAQTTTPSGFNFIDLTTSPVGQRSWDVELDLGAGMVLRLRRS